MAGPDKRLNAYRPDLAELSLRGRIEAAHFVAGQPAQIAAPVASIRGQPSASAAQLTQALMGETLKVFDRKDGWAWVKLDHDGYVGYVEASLLRDDVVAPTHEVATPSTLIYPKPDLKTQPALIIPMLARLSLKAEDKHEDRDYVELATGGFVYKRHLRPLNSGMGDYVDVAERFLFAPYYWGGKTIHGLDCSGLLQVAVQSVGMIALRDSDMQEETLGTALAPSQHNRLQRGDLVFWDGHVGIMADETNLLHANGFHMMVALEPLAAATERIGKTGKPVTSIRRF